jgi:glycosyltransferase involved in cell wall biosynthesis
MVSVLIPVYNYNVIELVSEVHKQLELCDILFEIKCLDDASAIEFQTQKQVVEELIHTSYLISKTNQGRIATRQQLADAALYDYVIFLDADVLPKSDDFIKNYLNYIDSNYDAIYGGIAYKDEKPASDSMLRWAYGKRNENVSALLRNKTPYKSIVSANFLMKTSVFKKVNSKINYSGYGSDNHFSNQLKKENIFILHIENEVYHLGIEKNATYLKKKEDAAIALIELYRTQAIKEHDNQLLKLFVKLKRLKLNYPISFFFKLSNSILRKNLLGPKPNVNMLQLYRISYMCFKDLNP